MTTSNPAQRAHQALRQIGLDAHHDEMPPQLLPGQRYQVLIARAMINNPPILLYAQPSHGGEPAVAETAADLTQPTQAQRPRRHGGRQTAADEQRNLVDRQRDRETV